MAHGCLISCNVMGMGVWRQTDVPTFNLQITWIVNVWIFIKFKVQYSCWPTGHHIKSLSAKKRPPSKWSIRHANVPLTRYANLLFAHAPGMPERFLRYRLERKLRASDPGTHHGTCVTQVPRCMSGSPTGGAGKTFPAYPAHAQPAILRIW